MHYEWTQVIVAGLSGGLSLAVVNAFLLFVAGALQGIISGPGPSKAEITRRRQQLHNERCGREEVLKTAMRYHRAGGQPPIPASDVVATAALFGSYLDGSHFKSSQTPL